MVRFLVVKLSLYLMEKTILIIVQCVAYYMELHNAMSFIINVFICQVKMLTFYIVQSINLTFVDNKRDI